MPNSRAVYNGRRGTCGGVGAAVEERIDHGPFPLEHGARGGVWP